MSTHMEKVGRGCAPRPLAELYLPFCVLSAECVEGSAGTTQTEPRPPAAQSPEGGAHERVCGARME